MSDLRLGDLNDEQQDRFRGVQDALGGRRPSRPSNSQKSERTQPGEFVYVDGGQLKTARYVDEGLINHWEVKGPDGEWQRVGLMEARRDLLPKLEETQRIVDERYNGDWRKLEDSMRGSDLRPERLPTLGGA